MKPRIPQPEMVSSITDWAERVGLKENLYVDTTTGANFLVDYSRGPGEHVSIGFTL